MASDRVNPPVRRCPPPGARQSLSPFESQTVTMVVWWSLLVASTAMLTLCWVLWI